MLKPVIPVRLLQDDERVVRNVQIMQNPVTFSDGYAYDRAAIVHYLEQTGGPIKSPLTGKTLEDTKFVPNLGLALAIKSYLQRNDRPLTKYLVSEREGPLLPSCFCVSSLSRVLGTKLHRKIPRYRVVAHVSSPHRRSVAVQN